MVDTRTGLGSTQDDTPQYQKRKEVFQGARGTCEDTRACLKVLRSPADVMQEPLLPTDKNIEMMKLPDRWNVNTTVELGNYHLAISDSSKNF